MDPLKFKHVNIQSVTPLIFHLQNEASKKVENFNKVLYIALNILLIGIPLLVDALIVKLVLSNIDGRLEKFIEGELELKKPNTNFLKIARTQVSENVDNKELKKHLPEGVSLDIRYESLWYQKGELIKSSKDYEKNPNYYSFLDLTKKVNDYSELLIIKLTELWIVNNRALRL